MPNPNWWDECQVKCTCAWQVISGKLAPHLVEVEPLKQVYMGVTE